MDYFKDLLKDTGYESLALEELELSRDEHYWLITIGYTKSGTIILGSSTRMYKLFKIDAESGEVVSMKIRIVP